MKMSSASSSSSITLLAGPLVCPPNRTPFEHHQTSTLLLPPPQHRSLPRHPTTSPSSITQFHLTLLSVPDASNYRPENDSIIASQLSTHASAEGGPGWLLTYNLVERKIRWHIYGVKEVTTADGSDELTPSACYSRAKAAVARPQLPPPVPADPGMTNNEFQIMLAESEKGRALAEIAAVVSPVKSTTNGITTNGISHHLSTPVTVKNSSTTPSSSPSSLTTSSSTVTPSTSSNSHYSIVLSTTEPILPFTLYDITLEFNAILNIVTLRVNDSLISCQLEQIYPHNSNIIFARGPLFIGGLSVNHIYGDQSYSSFIGLIADVTFDADAISVNNINAATTPSAPSGLLQHVASYLNNTTNLSNVTTSIPPPSRSEPLHSFQQLLSWQPNSDPLQLTPIPLPRERCGPPIHAQPLHERRRVIHCHDMGGGFQEDADTQHGLQQYHAYNFQFWKFIDIFIYFSHARIAIPPTMWITTAHKNGVKILANLCTEWVEGEKENIRLLDGLSFDPPNSHNTDDEDDAWRQYVRQMVALATEYNFDGWFLNIEAALSQPPSSEHASSPNSPSSTPMKTPNTITRPSYVVKLVDFVSYLSELMHTSRPDSLVLWYDSIRASDGALKWQSRLNDENLDFFQVADGIFTDYHWQREWPQESAIIAGDERKGDIFTGVDLYGRGSYGFDIMEAVKVIQDAQTSLALFAPAWTYEGEERRAQGRQAFLHAERKLWLGDDPWREVALKNGEASSADKSMNLQGWKCENEDGWEVVVRESAANAYCFVTSHEWSMREQLIDLEANEFTPTQLNQSPPIVISIEVAGTPPNVKDHYKLCVTLLSSRHDELARYDLVHQCTTSDWVTLSHTFENYPKGVRYLHWQDGGKDEEKWAGHYGTRIGAAHVRIRLPSEKRVCLADFIDKNFIPFQPFVCGFNTGNGKHFFLDGKKMEGQSIRPTDSSSSTSSTTASSDESHPWFNLSLQDCQTMLVDGLLCDGTIFPTEPPSTFFHAQAHITHDHGYDGGSCLEFETEFLRPPEEDARHQMTPPFTVTFDCFEFGATAMEQADWHVSFIYARPSAHWSLGLRFIFDDEKHTQFWVEESEVPLEEDATPYQWRTIEGVIPAATFRVGSVSKIQVELRYSPFLASLESSQDIVKIIQNSEREVHHVRLGRIAVMPQSHMMNLAPPPSKIQFTRYLCMDTFLTEPEAASFLFEWNSPTPSDPAASYFPSSPVSSPHSRRASLAQPNSPLSKPFRSFSSDFRGYRHSMMLPPTPISSPSPRASPGLLASSPTPLTLTSPTTTESLVTSWDVFINHRWHTRVLIPKYFIDSLTRDRIIGTLLSRSTSSVVDAKATPNKPLPSPSMHNTDGFHFAIRANYRTGTSQSLREAFANGIMIPWQMPAPSTNATAATSINSTTSTPGNLKLPSLAAAASPSSLASPQSKLNPRTVLVFPRSP